LRSALLLKQKIVGAELVVGEELVEGEYVLLDLVLGGFLLAFVVLGELVVGE